MSDYRLCGLPTGEAPLRADDVGGAFCCRGCLEVARRVDDLDADGTDAAASAVDPDGPPPGADATGETDATPSLPVRKYRTPGRLPRHRRPGSGERAGRSPT